MALITCKDCKGKVSDKAQFCPHCGCPIITNCTIKIIPPGSPTDKVAVVLSKPETREKIFLFCENKYRYPKYTAQIETGERYNIYCFWSYFCSYNAHKNVEFFVPVNTSQVNVVFNNVGTEDGYILNCEITFE